MLTLSDWSVAELRDFYTTCQDAFGRAARDEAMFRRGPKPRINKPVKRV